MSQEAKFISVVTACYNEQENVREVYEQVRREFEQLPAYTYEHIFIDNASADGTVAILKELAAADPRVKLIVNTRNFGHIRSPFHALMQAKGDAVISIVADLQDPVELIKEFLKKWEAGYKVVVGIKVGSDESKPMYAVRKLYYDIIGSLADVKLLKNFTGFGLYDQQVIATLRDIGDPYPYFRGLICDLGFATAEIEYVQPIRKRGITKNNFYTLYDMAMLGLTNHSKVPLRLATMLGFAMSFVSLLIGLAYLVYKLLFWQQFTLGLAPVVIGLFFFASVQLIFLGIVGEYVGAIHTQVLKRPLVIEKAAGQFLTGMEKRQKINLIGFIILAGFALATLVCYVKGAYLQLLYPENTFLFKPTAAFTDFSGLYDFLMRGNPYTQLNASPYYPLANLVVFLFTLLPLEKSFFLFVFGFLACLTWFNARNLAMGDRLELARNVFIFTFLTYPVLFALDRGNLECLLVLFVLYFAHFFMKERYDLAAFFLSLAIAMKAFPVILSLLFLARRQYRAFVMTAVSTVVVTVFSLVAFRCNPVTYISMVLHGGNIAHDNTFSAFSAANWAFQRGAGLFGVYKLALLNFHVIKLMDMSRWLALYYGVAVSLMGLIAAYVIWIEKQTWKQMALLVFAMLLLPHISSDYRLLYLFVPLLLFINAERSPRRDVAYAVLFGLLLIPKDYFFIPQTETDSLTGDNLNWAPAGISILLNPLLLLAFSTLIVTEGFKERAERKRIHA